MSSEVQVGHPVVVCQLLEAVTEYFLLGAAAAAPGAGGVAPGCQLKQLIRILSEISKLLLRTTKSQMLMGNF